MSNFVSCLSCCLLCSYDVFLRFCHLLLRCLHLNIKRDNSSLTNLIVYQDYSLWVF